MIVIDKLGIKDKVIDKLKEVFDPEIPVDIFELGLVYELLTEENGIAKITMTLTAPACPAADQILRDVQEKVGELEEVKEVRVEITFDPPWDREMMSEEAKLELGFL
ncbi:metal-sulfur cluster assembly factor [Pedobacter sp. SYSU D00535]|uniref:metal-sulfur cluster assembly factor n=1 Tax=Pedobacter sp. SYSU D00535 TaxID=2810308 RepID=UPI001A96DBD6|nr:iron-sulfur cluster assembly protein [Pedobacter sp. SYSU D00535]